MPGTRTTMPKNNRLPATLTRSISWRFDVLAALDQRAEELRTDRSTFVNGVMEHMLGLYPHPEFVGRDVPFAYAAKAPPAERVRELEQEANRDRETKRLRKASKAEAAVTPVAAGGLVRRPGRRSRH